MCPTVCSRAGQSSHPTGALKYGKLTEEQTQASPPGAGTGLSSLNPQRTHSQLTRDRQAAEPVLATMDCVC
jgi:hypothetical protein